MFIIACSKTKQSEQQFCIAEQMYISPLFRKSVEYANKMGEPYYILSGRYGLLHPEHVIEVYNETLGEKSKVEQRVWANRVLIDLLNAVSIETSVTFLTGKTYYALLYHPMLEIGYKMYFPLDGMGIGRRLNWLNTRLGENL